MKPLLLSLTALAATLSACAKTTGEAEPVPAISTYDSGVPQFTSVPQAIAYAIEESNLLAYKGVVFGSEHFKVTLPSGQVVSNWQIDCYFRDVFRPFGTDAYPQLADLLLHEHEFVQVGAYSVLNSYMNTHGLGRKVHESTEKRSETVERLKAILAQGDF